MFIMAAVFQLHMTHCSVFTTAVMGTCTINLTFNVLHKGSRGKAHSCKTLKHIVGGGEAAPGRTLENKN